MTKKYVAFVTGEDMRELITIRLMSIVSYLQDINVDGHMCDELRQQQIEVAMSELANVSVMNKDLIKEST